MQAGNADVYSVIFYTIEILIAYLILHCMSSFGCHRAMYVFSVFIYERIYLQQCLFFILIQLSLN